MTILSAASVGASLASPRIGNPNFGDRQPVGSHTNMAHLGTTGNGSNAASYLVKHTIAVATKTISLVYSNTVQDAANGPNAITIKAALRRSDTAMVPLTFKGQESFTLQPGCDVETDPVSCPVAAGDYVQSITYVSVAAAGLWPLNVQISRTFNQEGYIAGSDRTRDYGANGDWDMSTNRSAFAPTLVLGSTASTAATIGVEGDSITVGQNDVTLLGHWERGLAGVYSHALIGNGGQTSSNSARFYQAVRRLRWLAGCTHTICAYGANDVAGGASAATTAASLLLFWQSRASLGGRVYQATIPPNTTSSDSWATAGGQTVKSFEAVSSPRLASSAHRSAPRRLHPPGATAQGASTPHARAAYRHARRPRHLRTTPLTRHPSPTSPPADRPATRAASTHPSRSASRRSSPSSAPSPTRPKAAASAPSAIMAWRSGLRVAELCALDETDLDRRDYAITVRSGKGGKRRVSAMDDWGWDQLAPWLDERRQYPIGALFPVLHGPTAGRPLATTIVRAAFRKTTARSGLRVRIHPHALRHAHAVELWREGVDIYTISRQLGHANVAITAHYLQSLAPLELLEPIGKRARP
jgi:integrase